MLRHIELQVKTQSWRRLVILFIIHVMNHSVQLGYTIDRCFLFNVSRHHEMVKFAKFSLFLYIDISLIINLHWINLVLDGKVMTLSFTMFVTNIVPARENVSF